MIGKTAGRLVLEAALFKNHLLAKESKICRLPNRTHKSILRRCLLGFWYRRSGRFQLTQSLMLVQCCVHALVKVARQADTATLSWIQVSLQQIADSLVDWCENSFFAEEATVLGKPTGKRLYQYRASACNPTGVPR